MTDNNRKIVVNSLDFFEIKNNLKTYLSGLDEFSDFNFEGSGSSILLDLLSYVTHYQGFYNNMVANEMFLDSAVKRSSIVSHAKSLGYTPSSSTASTATIDITINDSEESTTYLTKRSKFTASKDNVTYTFYNSDVETFEVLNSTQKIARNVKISEGTWRNASFLKDTNLGKQRFIIPEKNVDMSKLNVYVQKSTTDSTGWSDTWSKVSDVTSLTSTSKVYFTQETEDGHYEIYFGDGVLGSALQDGNLVVIEYLVTNGLDANDIGTFDREGSRSFSSSISNVADIAVVVSSNGGRGKETLESIRYNAPKAHQSQNRNVTTSDYKSYIQSNYSNASDVFVWGGEDNSPPEYGKVFISVKPTNATVLNNEEKISLRNLIKDQNVVSIIPDVVDPNYLYINITTKVFYDSDKTKKSAKDIAALVQNQILIYDITNLEKFSRNFRHSKFVKSIDDTDESILGNQTSITIEKRITPTTGEKKSYTIKFENPLFHPHDGHMSILASSGFVYTKEDGSTCTAYLDDDGSGKIRMYELIDLTKNYITEDLGSIDYATGKITLKDFMPTSIVSGILKLRCIPQNSDVLAERNSIITLDASAPDSINVSVELYQPYGSQSVDSNYEISTPSVSSVSDTTTTTSSSETSASSSSSDPAGPLGGNNSGGSDGGGGGNQSSSSPSAPGGY